MLTNLAIEAAQVASDRGVPVGGSGGLSGRRFAPQLIAGASRAVDATGPAAPR